MRQTTSRFLANLNLSILTNIRPYFFLMMSNLHVSIVKMKCSIGIRLFKHAKLFKLSEILQ